ELAAEVASGEQLLVILEPDPDAWAADQFGLEAEQDGRHERVGDQSDQHHQAWREEQPGGRPIAAQHSAQADDSRSSARHLLCASQAAPDANRHIVLPELTRNAWSDASPRSAAAPRADLPAAARSSPRRGQPSATPTPRRSM